MKYTALEIKGNGDALEEIQKIVASLDVMSSLLAEVKVGSKLGNTFVLLLNLFLMEKHQLNDSQMIEDLSVLRLATSANLECYELAQILTYLTEKGLIACQPKKTR